MQPEQMFEKLLNLGEEWTVKRVELQGEGIAREVVIEVAERPVLWKKLRCPETGGEVTCYDHTEELAWRHLNVFEYRCEIRCRLPRAKSRQTEKVFRVPVPWEGLSKHFTFGFEAAALLLLREMPVKKVGEVLGETDQRLWRMLREQVSAAHALVDMSELRIVGCDEMAIAKGHNYITAFADLARRQVLFATLGRDKETWQRFADELIMHNADATQITQASMDMSPAYQAGAAQVCPQATIVFDPFHVIKQVSEAVDEVRRRESKETTEQKHDDLYKTRWLWLKNPENLTDEQAAHLAALQKCNLLTAKAYQMRLTLQDIYALSNVILAKKKLLQWCTWVTRTAKRQPPGLFDKMADCAGMIRRHLVGILAHWATRTTNAYMEGLFSVFSATKRKARGYRNPDNLIAMLYLVAGKLDLPVHPNTILAGT
jgi:transposase